jgi:hypothetical protein
MIAGLSTATSEMWGKNMQNLFSHLPARKKKNLPG